jgi:hypothetical protein
MEYIKAVNLGIVSLIFYSLMGKPSIEWQLFTFSMTYFVMLILLKMWELFKNKKSKNNIGEFINE